MLGLSVTCCDVGSVSRFPPFRNRDLLQPLSFLVFKLSPYPAAFFLHGCLRHAQACHWPHSLAFSLLPSLLVPWKQFTSQAVTRPQGALATEVNLSGQALTCLAA